MTPGLSVPVTPLSIWHPIHLGTDETGQPVYVNLAERNMLIGGEPGGGKSVALQLIVAHGALSSDCKLILIDGKRVELGLWRECAEKFVGPSMDDAISVLGWLQELIDERTDVLLQMKKRKVTPDLGWPFYLVPIDEVAYFSATKGTPAQQKEFNASQPRRGRPRPRPGHHPRRGHPAALRRHHPDLYCGTCSATGWAFRCKHGSILGHDPGARLGQQRLLSHRDRPPGTRSVLAARRRRHPPPRQGRVPLR